RGAEAANGLALLVRRIVGPTLPVCWERQRRWVARGEYEPPRDPCNGRTSSARPRAANDGRRRALSIVNRPHASQVAIQNEHVLSVAGGEFRSCNRREHVQLGRVAQDSGSRRGRALYIVALARLLCGVLSMLDRIRQPTVARPIVSVLIAGLLWSSTYSAWADAFRDSATLGDQTGKAIIPKDVGTADSAGNITLLPNSSKPVQLEASDLFPGATGNYSSFTSIYGNDQAMIKQGQEAQKTLEAEPSRTGDAYRVLTKSK